MKLVKTLGLAACALALMSTASIALANQNTKEGVKTVWYLTWSNITAADPKQLALCHEIFKDGEITAVGLGNGKLTLKTLSQKHIDKKRLTQLINKNGKHISGDGPAYITNGTVKIKRSSLDTLALGLKVGKDDSEWIAVEVIGDGLCTASMHAKRIAR